MLGTLRAFAALFLNCTGRTTEEHGAESPPELLGECKHTVLAIDDDPILLRTATSVLSKHGFNVLTSTTGAKGLNMLCYAPGDIEVVLLDYSMPHLNGAETLGHLRKLNPNVKVIALTAMDIDRIPKSFHDGVDKFVQKPFDARTVVDAIHSLVGTEAQPATSTPGQN
jgi:CheY-like chemotaxis protein